MCFCNIKDDLYLNLHLAQEVVFLTNIKKRKLMMLYHRALLYLFFHQNINDEGLIGSLCKILPEQRTQTPLPSSISHSSSSAPRNNLIGQQPSLANGYIVSHEWIMPTSQATDYYKRTSPPTEEEKKDRKKIYD
ncbi:hypothetical protein ACLOJK_015314, partial [Asimina triloba]